MWKRGILILLFAFAATSCAKESTPAPTATNTPWAAPVLPEVDPLVFATGFGSGEYDQMTYLYYRSRMFFEPQADLTGRFLEPMANYCNGECYSLTYIRDAYWRLIAVQFGRRVDDDWRIRGLTAERINGPVAFREGESYWMDMIVWTTKSIGIFTTGGRREGENGSGRYTVLRAYSNTADHLDRGAIAFWLMR